MRRIRGAAADLAELPLPARWALVLGLALGVVGGLVGLVLGLVGYPPTAWFAVLEVGVPAALLGAVVGLLVGLAVQLTRRRRPGSHTP
jgi:membrane associated rhomboid family serine protease